MSLQHILQRDVDTALASESAQAAAQRMRSRNVGMLVVVDAKLRPMGILTDRDLALSVVAEGRDPNQTQVLDVMTSEPVCLPEDKTTDDALTLMRKAGIRRLPVINARGLLVGVVSMDDVLKTVSEKLVCISEVLENSSPRRLAFSGEAPAPEPRPKIVKPARKRKAAGTGA